jgi:hypothetical protein
VVPATVAASLSELLDKELIAVLFALLKEFQQYDGE